MYGQQIFLPLDNDFILFSLSTRTITQELKYSENPFGVRPVISVNGKYIYYTKKLSNNLYIYRKNLNTQEENAFSVGKLFNSFRMLSSTDFLLDEHSFFSLPHSDASFCVSAYIEVLPLNPEKINQIYYDEEIFILPSVQGRLVEAYFLVQEEKFLLNILSVHEKEPWKSFYQWYLLDKNTSKLEILAGLRGRVNFDRGGVMFGDRPLVSYALELEDD